ncbi:hypothetical protein EX30DRAFT_370038 [Ascodesmis nigricans]|uniref:SRP9 domain-containing protein n=1 Tax=Ascodesmis nigricans TaxID=341454 RepID=A0A4S2N1S1_9PEZI|nr:hypothetical protein EX30DRAFT_370038 [Ascodesmis nigricans]
MKLCKTPNEFTRASLQLIAARPETTKTTTTYSSSTPGKGRLTLKTYDPVSGAVIKFKTNKIADVGRLVAGLQRVARGSLGLKVEEEEKEKTVVEMVTEAAGAVATAVADTATAATSGQAPASTGATGGGKKKGKGKGKKGR